MHAPLKTSTDEGLNPKEVWTRQTWNAIRHSDRSDQKLRIIQTIETLDAVQTERTQSRPWNRPSRPRPFDRPH